MTDSPENRGPAEDAPAWELPSDDAALLSECDVQTFRSGGKGGQHQNTTDSGVRFIHRPTGIVTTSRERRSQLQNRKLALERMWIRLREHVAVPEARIATRVPRREVAKRRDNKRRRSKTKDLRRPPSEES